MISRIFLFAILCAAICSTAGASERTTADPAAERPAIAEETERQKLALRRAVATGLRNEAYALQQKGQIRDAAIRYRQSLVYWPDTGLESYIAPLERRAGFQVSQYRPEARHAAAGGAATGPARVYATVRNRSARDITLAIRGEDPAAATTVRAGEIRIRPVGLGAGGEATFEVSRDGQVLETRTWKGNPNSSAVVPSLLYDDALQGRLFVMTGLR
jgi:hypothetical protein